MEKPLITLTKEKGNNNYSLQGLTLGILKGIQDALLAADKVNSDKLTSAQSHLLEFLLRKDLDKQNPFE